MRLSKRALVGALQEAQAGLGISTPALAKRLGWARTTLRRRLALDGPEAQATLSLDDAVAVAAALNVEVLFSVRQPGEQAHSDAPAPESFDLTVHPGDRADRPQKVAAERPRSTVPPARSDTPSRPNVLSRRQSARGRSGRDGFGADF